MSSEIVTEQELMRALDIGQRCKLIDYLQKKGIPYELTPKRKVWTVQKALDQAIIKQAMNDNEPEEWDFDDGQETNQCA